MNNNINKIKDLPIYLTNGTKTLLVNFCHLLG